jgi:hypothetical protein
METTFRPISKRRLSELRGYAAWTASLFRIAVFLGAVGIFGWGLAAAQRRLWRPHVPHGAWWIVPTVLAGGALYRRAGRWTGGRGFRAATRTDLERGLAAAHRITAVDAIEVEEQEDEGPAYFLLTAAGETMLFTGQYLDRYKRKGFPWRDFEILEAPESRVFFGLVPLGDRLAPSARRPPFTWDEYKRLCRAVKNYAVVDVDFEALKLGRIARR